MGWFDGSEPRSTFTVLPFLATARAPYFLPFAARSDVPLSGPFASLRATAENGVSSTALHFLGDGESALFLPFAARSDVPLGGPFAPLRATAENGVSSPAFLKHGRPFPPAGSLAQVTTDPIYGPFVTLPLLLVVRELWS